MSEVKRDYKVGYGKPRAAGRFRTARRATRAARAARTCPRC